MASYTQPREAGRLARGARSGTVAWLRRRAGDLRRWSWPGYALALLGVALMTALIALVSARVEVANISMAYLVVVLAIAAGFGRGPAVVAAIAASLADDIFFVGPARVHDLTLLDPLGQPERWLALALLLLTAVVAGQLAATMRERGLEAARRAREARVLYDVVRTLGDPDLDPPEALRQAAERARADLGLAAVAITLADAAGQDAAPAGPAGVRVVPIGVREQRLGLLHLARAPGAPPFGAADERLLQTLAAQIGLALERARLRRAALEAETLRRADEAKSALLRAVSHDLRTPLAGIIATAGNLREGGTWPAAERQGLAAIEAEARRLDRLVANLLDLSRIEAGALRPQRRWYDLGALLEEALERLGPLAARHRLVLAVPDDLPPLPLDYVQIVQVLVNLVENAAKYAPAGTEIGVAARLIAGAVEVTVADRGPGVPAAALPRIFAPFYRASASGSGTPGAGLGLAVARGLVVAHGGQIRAANRPGGGACFAFTLPLQPPERREEVGR